MSVPSQLGIFGWAKAANYDDVVASTNATGANWWRHKAAEISFGGIQDLRTFPPEVGGELIPTGAYKNGLYVGGGVSIQPRIQETFGHLLKSMMGNAVISKGGVLSGVTVVNAGSLAAIAALTVVGGTAVLATASNLVMVVAGIDPAVAGVSPQMYAEVKITGTDVSTAALVETIDIYGNGTFLTEGLFKTVTAVNVVIAPAADIASPVATISIGNDTTTAVNIHEFQMATNQSTLEWLNLRKFTPTALGGLGETMIGCKITGSRLTIPASGLVTCRMEFQGRRVVYANNPGWDTDNGYWDPTTGAYEDTTSVPISSAVGGAVMLPIGQLAKVTSVIINWANNVSTPEQERIVGSPFPDDVMALSRAMSIQATVK